MKEHPDDTPWNVGMMFQILEEEGLRYTIKGRTLPNGRYEVKAMVWRDTWAIPQPTIDSTRPTLLKALRHAMIHAWNRDHQYEKQQQRKRGNALNDELAAAWKVP